MIDQRYLFFMLSPDPEMKSLRLQISFCLVYFGGMLFAPVFGMEAHHCAPHTGQGNHTSSCPQCSRECLPETPLEHAFEEALLTHPQNWIPERYEYTAPIPETNKFNSVESYSLSIVERVCTSTPDSGRTRLSRAPPCS